MKTFWAVVLAAVLVAVVWGGVVGMRPAPTRVEKRVVHVGPDWYASLAKDPATATVVYLARSHTQ